jgi:hypothetical protein
VDTEYVLEPNEANKGHSEGFNFSAPLNQKAAASSGVIDGKKQRTIR